MRILNFGSLNVDYVYSVEYFVRAGETLKVHSRQVLPGGKGLNQSVALARAGADVCHAGCIGPEGAFLRELLDENGVDTNFEYLDCIEYEGVEYLVLMPEGDESGEIVILEVEPVDEELENYLAVEDEAVLSAVFAIFKEKFQDVFTFED